MGMPAPPSDTRAQGQAGHITDHNTISDALSWLATEVAAIQAGQTGGGVQLAGDLGGTTSAPQVVSAHLASALPLAQGGTGVAAGSNGALLTALGALAAASNLSDVASPSAARTSLGLGTASLASLANLLQVSNNLSDLASPSAARTSLGLSAAATATLPLAVANGGTGATTAAGARANLGVTSGGGGGAGTDWIVLAPSGDTTGVTDTGNIPNSLNNAAPGAVVYLSSGTYYINAAITIPASRLLLGAVGLDVPYVGDHGTVLRLTSAFSGGAALIISNGSNGSTFSPAGSVSNLAIDGAAYTSTAVDGLQGLGNCIRAIVSGVVLGNMSGWGYRSINDTSAPAGQQLPMFWDFKDVLVQANALGGMGLTTQNDTYYNNVYVLGCGTSGNGPGWLITNGAANCRFDNCRSEWSGGYGVYITGVSWNGNGSGGSIWANFSTDRNQWDGIKIDATGGGPITFTNLMLRRDGRNNKTGGGGYSCFNANGTTLPITIGTLHVYPGTDDDGTGTSSPQNGVSVTNCSSVTIGSGFIQAATTPINNGGGNTYFYSSPGIITATGPTTAPVNFNGTAEQGNGIALTGMPAAALTGVNTLQSLMTGMTVPANGAYAGQTYNFDIWGKITTTVNTQQVTLAIYLGGTGGTQIGTTGAASPNAGGAVTNVPFRFRGKIQFQSGTSVTATWQLYMNFFLTTMGVQQTTVSTTTAKAFAIGYTPSDVAVSLTIQGGTFRRSLD
jgi:hypothetical protein